MWRFPRTAEIPIIGTSGVPPPRTRRSQRDHKSRLTASMAQPQGYPPTGRGAGGGQGRLSLHQPDAHVAPVGERHAERCPDFGIVRPPQRHPHPPLAHGVVFRYKYRRWSSRPEPSWGRCCMKTLRGWGGLARTSRDPPRSELVRRIAACAMYARRGCPEPLGLGAQVERRHLAQVPDQQAPIGHDGVVPGAAVCRSG